MKNSLPPRRAGAEPAKPQAASPAVRVYACQPANMPARAAPDVASSAGGGEELNEFIRSMIDWRKTERDMDQIMTDPSKLAGYHDLPAAVQELAKTDPMTFWMAWQLAQQGFDFGAMDEFQQELDKALRAAGWDGAQAPTDEHFAQAEQALMRALEE